MGICFQKNRVRSGQRNWSVRVCHYHNGIIEKEHIMSKICHFYSVVQAQFCILCFRYFNSVAFYSVALIAFVFSLVSYKVVLLKLHFYLYIHLYLQYTMVLDVPSDVPWHRFINRRVILDLHITQAAEKRFPKKKCERSLSRLITDLSVEE